MNPGEQIKPSHQLLRKLSDISLYIFCYKQVRIGQKSYWNVFHTRSNNRHFDIWKQFLILSEVSNVFILTKCKTVARCLCPHANKESFWESTNVCKEMKNYLKIKEQKNTSTYSKFFFLKIEWGLIIKFWKERKKVGRKVGERK